MKTIALSAAALLLAAGSAFAGSDHFGSQAEDLSTWNSPVNTQHDYQPTRKHYNAQSRIDPMTSSSIGTSSSVFPKNSNHDYQPTHDIQPQFRH